MLELQNFSPNQQLAEKLSKTIIIKFEKRKVYSSFKSYICEPNVADTQLISQYNQVFQFLLCAYDTFSKIHGLFL